ncbi:MAG TPA: hypothetical protein VFC19_13485 [Candidatus Limnocylindrales bacterium]|nr:hypothetical protein [Candidatus Limnocylindrales bacterium]
MTDSVTVTDQRAPERASNRSGWIAFAGIALLIAALVVLRRSLSLDSGDVALVIAWGSLPLLTLSGISAGAAAGMWAVHVFGRVPRIAASVLAGSATGVLASAAVFMLRGVPSSAILVLALALALSGALGGAIAAIRPAEIARGGVPATLAALLLFFVVAFNSSWLLPLFGADGTAAGNHSANGLLAGAQALLIGLISGFVAYFTIRRSGAACRWPVYMLAGGLPGLFYIVADLFTRVGTTRLLSLAVSDTTVDRLVSTDLGAGRINTGLVLFFVGAITAMIAFGRTLKPADPDSAG